MGFQQAAAFFLLLCTAGQLVQASFPLPPGAKSPSPTPKTAYSPPASPPAYSPPTYSPSPRPSPPPYSPPSPPSSPPSWKPAVYGVWPGRYPKTFPVWKPAFYSAPYTGGKQRSLRENMQPVNLFKSDAAASQPTNTQARFPAAGTVLQLQQTLDLHSVLYTLVWGQRAQQVETTPDGKPAGPTFSLGSFEAQDDELQWSYTNGDSNWCPQARKTQVHYTVHAAQTTYRLDKVEEPEPCSFTFYVSGP